MPLIPNGTACDGPFVTRSMTFRVDSDTLLGCHLRSAHGAVCLLIWR